MKKVVIAALLLTASLGLFAQANSWYFSVLPGYQFKSSDAKANFMLSLDGGYYFTDNVGLHFAYAWNNGKYQTRLLVPTYYDFEHDFNMKSSWSMIEVGPEFVGKAGENGQIYGQINVGYTFGNSDTNLEYYGDYYEVGKRDNKFVYGAAFGYRYFFNKRVGMSFQGAYHHIDWGSTEHGYVGIYPYTVTTSAKNFWDARIGVTWKF